MSTRHHYSLPHLIKHRATSSLFMGLVAVTTTQCQKAPAGQQTLKARQAKRPDAPFVAFGFVDKARVQSGTQTTSYTHVVALGSANSFSTAPIEPDGSFALGLQTGELQAVGFVDSASGSGSVGAILSSQDLQALAPQTNGEVDLKVVLIDGTVATPSLPHEDLIDALGLTPEEAQTIGGADDLLAASLRPTAEPGPISLETHSHWRWRDENQLSYLFVGNEAPSTHRLRYMMSSLQFFSAKGRLTGPYSLTLDEAVRVQAQAQVLNYPAGAAIPEATLTGGTNPPPGTEMLHLPLANAEVPPSGRYQLLAGAEKLSFGPIVIDKEKFKSANNKIVAMVWGKPVTAGCEADCELAAFGWKWFKHSSSGLQAATLSEVRLAVRQSPYFSIELSQRRRFSAELSKTALSGEVSLTSLQAQPGADQTALAGLKDTQLCSVSVASRDVTGVTQFFEQIEYDFELCSGSP